MIVEEHKVTVTEWVHDPQTKRVTMKVEGPDANHTLRNTLAHKGVRPDWVTNAYASSKKSDIF